jgi:hypothetical protein
VPFFCVKRGDNIKIKEIFHYVAQNNAFLTNSKTGSKHIIHKLKIQMQYQSERNSLKPEPNEEYNSILVSFYIAQILACLQNV